MVRPVLVTLVICCVVALYQTNANTLRQKRSSTPKDRGALSQHLIRWMKKNFYDECAGSCSVNANGEDDCTCFGYFCSVETNEIQNIGAREEGVCSPLAQFWGYK
ncbi:unnamed protein product [Owenia fusiformis]|uniref:Uncharacterized protein n=1 Tax=Owenia fusiformis TaxID=6347 RepID=A0A8J1U8X5_OWEFU|nr:unnamed protein product [Owenia fusiformis]